LRQRRRVTHRECVRKDPQSDAGQEGRDLTLRGLRGPRIVGVWRPPCQHQRHQRLGDQVGGGLAFDQHRAGVLFPDRRAAPGGQLRGEIPRAGDDLGHGRHVLKAIFDQAERVPQQRPVV
jgi:hypothetical protein